MKLVLSTGLFDHVETGLLPDLIPLLRDAGFGYLEVVDRKGFDDNESILDDLRNKAEECGIEIPNWHLVQYSPFQETKEECRIAIDCMKRSMDKGHRIGAKNHVLHWDQRFLDESYKAIWRDVIDEWTDHAKKLGIRLLMETVPDKPTNQRYVPCSEIIEFVRKYPPEILSVCIDVNHSNLKEELPDVVYLMQDRLISLHISDNNGKSEQHWLPGKGVINFPQLFDSLDGIRFNGFFVIEINKWCEAPEHIIALKRLHAFGMNLLENHTPDQALLI